MLWLLFLPHDLHGTAHPQHACAKADGGLCWGVGELAGVGLQALGSQFGDSTGQWLYRLARGCDTEEVDAAAIILTALPRRSAVTILTAL